MDHATNAAKMRINNRRLILNMIRLGPVSRVELAERAHLTRASITQIVDGLIADGLVEAVSTVEGGGLGRRRTQLALRHGARYVFGVSISRMHCRVGVVDLYGDVLMQSQLPVIGRDAEGVVRAAAAEICRQRAELGLDPALVLGTGVSTPGPVDYLRGRILNPPNFDAWHGLPICDMLTGITGFPALLEKDTNARALEERYFGAARDIDSFLLVQIDEGVGSGVVTGDRLYRGTRGMGSEIGHTSIRYDGPVCACGNRGCLEGYVSIPALLRGTRFGSWEELAAGADTADAAQLLDGAAEYLASALVSAVNLYDIDRVILTGEVARSPQPLLMRLNRLLRERVLSRERGCTVSASMALSPVRTGAMAALYDVFQER